MIKPGDTIPAVSTWCVDNKGSRKIDTGDYFSKGITVLFTLPGAYTPTCHIHHLPGYVANFSKFKSLGVDRIVCASVNDHHVMNAWAKDQNALDSLEFLADFDATFACALGLTRDLHTTGLGTRFIRSAFIIENALVKSLFVDEIPGQLTNTGALSILDVIEAQYAKEATHG